MCGPVCLCPICPWDKFNFSKLPHTHTATYSNGKISTLTPHLKNKVKRYLPSNKYEVFDIFLTYLQMDEEPYKCILLIGCLKLDLTYR